VKRPRVRGLIFVSRFVHENSKNYVHFLILSAIFCSKYCIKKGIRKRPRIRGLIFMSRYVHEKLKCHIHLRLLSGLLGLGFA
jgi:hypothetical protein